MRTSWIIGAGIVVLTAAPAFACTSISSAAVKLSGCVDEQWQTTTPNGQEFAYLTADQNFALQIVTEPAVLAAQQLHDAIIANAVTASGSKDGVKEIGERVESVDGKPFNVLEYTVVEGPNTFDFQNLYYSAPGFGTVQILAVSLPKDAAAAAFKQGQFAATVKVGE